LALVDGIKRGDLRLERFQWLLDVSRMQGINRFEHRLFLNSSPQMAGCNTQAVSSVAAVQEGRITHSNCI
jgi:hypothetical protein